ncbi:hypothetical protein [Streptacidiphilus sp. BW17]|uniref:hypothetical protein n=1 Tax=Streptacidiphilus sp. BW17 TaxID=3156274 RepID=UPI003518DACF
MPKRFVTVAAFVSAAGAFVINASASAISGNAKDCLIGVASLLFLISIGSVKLNEHRNVLQAEEDRQDAIREATELRSILDGWLEPYAFNLLRAKTFKGNAKAVQIGVVKKVLLGVQKILERRVHDEVRMCFFKLEVKEPRTLSCDIWEGGAKPRDDFVEGTESGDFAFRSLEVDDVTYVSEAFECVKPPLWADRSYKCYMSSPVKYGEELLGMLTVDSANTDAITEFDKIFVKAIASLLAVTLRV